MSQNLRFVEPAKGFQPIVLCVVSRGNLATKRPRARITAVRSSERRRERALRPESGEMTMGPELAREDHIVWTDDRCSPGLGIESVAELCRR
jgi:hypothetical protein